MVLGDLESSLEADEGQLQLLPDTQPKQLAVDFSDRHGYVNKAKLLEEFPRLKLVEATAERQRFLHWDLEFADVLMSGGFDLIVGNPPWIKMNWDPSSILEDIDPISLIRSEGATESTSRAIDRAKMDAKFRRDLIDDYCYFSAIGGFLGSTAQYPWLEGTTTNLYKAFICQSLYLCKPNGICGLLSPPGILTEPSAAAIRKETCLRLRLLINFENQLKLFSEIGNTRKYSLYILLGSPGCSLDKQGFEMISNCLHPSTVNECLSQKESNGYSECPGIKEYGKWSTRGHKDRCITYTIRLRNVASRLLNCHDQEFPPLLFPHSKGHAETLAAIAESKIKFGDLLDDGRLQYIRGIPEKEAQDKKLIVKGSRFPLANELYFVLSAHIGNGRPFQMSPKRVCNTHRAFDVHNPLGIDTVCLPRSNFAFSAGKDGSRIYEEKWGASEIGNLCELKILMSKRIDLSGERSVFSAMYPVSFVHTGTVVGFVASSQESLILAQGYLSSVFSDLHVRTSGSADLTRSVVSGFPFPFLIR